MGERKGETARRGRQAARKEGEERDPGRRFGYEMAFDPRFEGRRWSDVEPALRSEYVNWAKTHGFGDVAEDAWERVKGHVREAWESALEIARTQIDPRTGRWEAVSYTHLTLPTICSV